MPACTDCTSVKVRHRQEKHCVRDNTLITSRFLRRRGFSFAGECTSVILLTAEVHITVQFSYESSLSAMTGSLKAEIRCVQVNRTPMLEFSIIIPRLQEKKKLFSFDLIFLRQHDKCIPYHKEKAILSQD